MCTIIPGPAVASARGIMLAFRPGLRTVATLAADPARVSEIILARIILAEEFDSSPAIVPVPERPAGQMLHQAEAAELEVLTGLGATVGGSDHDSPRGFTYEFSDETADALQEYLRYAHFHGLLPDIPALNFYGE
jgi:hypothetical protein